MEHSVCHVQNLKLMFARAKTGYDIEIASLSKNLHRNERLLKESVKGGTAILTEYKIIEST